MGFNGLKSGPSLLHENITDHFVSIHILILNSMGSWYMNLSDNTGGRCLWKLILSSSDHDSPP